MKFDRLCNQDKRIFISICCREWGLKTRQVYNILSGLHLTAEQLATLCDLLQSTPNELLTRKPLKPLAYHTLDESNKAAAIASHILHKHFKSPLEPPT